MNWLSPANENPDGNFIEDEEQPEIEEQPKISLKKKVSLEKKVKPTSEAVEGSDVTVVAAEISTDTTVNTVAAAITSETNLDSDVAEVLTEIPISTDVTIVNVTNNIDDNSKTEVVESDTKSAKVINLFDNQDDSEKLEQVNSDEDVSEDEEEDKSMFDWNEVRAINNKQIAEGVKFGIGLAFLSMALNGLTDDLLFNIPTSILMWILAALAAAIDCSPKEEITSTRRHRRK